MCNCKPSPFQDLSPLDKILAVIDLYEQVRPVMDPAEYAAVISDLQARADRLAAGAR